MIIALYVDDLLIFSNAEAERKMVKKVLSSEFEMKGLGHVKKMLGIRVRREKGIVRARENFGLLVMEYILTCQRLKFGWYREPATENVTSPQFFTAPEVVTRNHDGGNRKPLSLWQRQYGGPNNNMAAK